MQTVVRPTLVMEKFGKRKRVPYQAYLGPLSDHDLPWRPQDPILWVEREEDMYALLAPQYRGVVVAVVRRNDWLHAPEVEGW